MTDDSPRQWLSQLCPRREKQPELGPYLKVASVARELGVSRQTIYRVIAEGRLPFSRLGAGRGTIRIRRSDLVKFLEQIATSVENV
jgi:excisionase family DNA binding protein